MTRSTTNNPAVLTRRTMIGGAGMMAVLGMPAQAHANQKALDHSFVVLLKGLYQPVTHGPNLGLSTVDLGDGSYSKTKIYPVHGIAGSEDSLTAVGRFYVQFEGDLCAYDLPGGALAMRFHAKSHTKSFDDGQGGSLLQGTWDLTVVEATGLFHRFVGGHNHMLDSLHFLAPGDGSGGVDEYCVCFVRLPRHHN